MEFFNGGMFWFIEGILFTLIIISVNIWAKDKNITITSWKWLLLILWIVLLGFSIAFVTTSYGEGEPTAGFRGGMLFGLITIISGVGLWRVILMGKVAAK